VRVQDRGVDPLGHAGAGLAWRAGTMRIDASGPRDDPNQDDDRDGARTGRSAAAIGRGVRDHLTYTLGLPREAASRNDAFLALALTIRDRLLARAIEGQRAHPAGSTRMVCYLSAEFLLGPQLACNLAALELTEAARDAMASEGIDLEELVDHEEEPGLGGGGLGRLAACLLESLATLGVPCVGYGIRYEFGIFDQRIRDGAQLEIADKWLALGNPWELARPETTYEVAFGGRTEIVVEPDGRESTRWIPTRRVRGVAVDTPIAGHHAPLAGVLRLWRAEACEAFDLAAFQQGDYYRAVEQKVVSETITKILYPNDEGVPGKRLRLEQQHFFVTCSLRDMIREHLRHHPDVRGFDRHFAVQLNDTHPALAVAELMRLLVDEHRLGWDEAWSITEGTLAYTNHTRMPEALERWPVDLFAELLPRHLEIVREIDRRLLATVRARFPGDEGRAARMAIVSSDAEPTVRMAHLAVVGCRAVNGVSRLHGALLREAVLPDFAALWPHKFASVTNGVSPRRFVRVANPRLARWITDALGTDRWAADLERLHALEPLAVDAGALAALGRVKAENKAEFAQFVARTIGRTIDPAALVVVLAKRFHEYKRQLLALLSIVADAHAIATGRDPGGPARLYVFAGKAAPNYAMAKLVLRLAHGVAAALDGDPRVRGRLGLVFLPDYNVKLAQRIVPAAELSLQLSLAGTEASGTGNMKLAMNGALTVGTRDGANLEIAEAVGPEGFFLFGPDARETELRARRRERGPIDPDLAGAIDALASGAFSPDDRARFAPIADELRGPDRYQVCADFRTYRDAERAAAGAYLDPPGWNRRSLRTIARMGPFSSDRCARAYCERIWGVAPRPSAPPNPAPSVRGLALTAPASCPSPLDPPGAPR
jgi:starch phosphorylase